MIEPSESAGGPGSDVSSAEEYRAYVDGVLEDGKFKRFCQDLRNNPEFVKLGISSLQENRIVKFYVSCGEKEEDTRRVLSEALAWRLKYNYGNLLNEDYSAHERERKLYFISRAKIGYPVLVWKSQRHYAKKHKYTESIRFIVQTIEKAIRGGTLSHRVILLIDSSGATTKNAESASFMRSLCHILQLNFPEALEKSVVERVVLLSESDFRSYLSTIIPKEGLPRAYGGAAPDDSPVEGFCSPDRSPNPISGDERRDPAGEISIEAPLGSKPPCRDDISVAAHALSQ